MVEEIKKKAGEKAVEECVRRGWLKNGSSVGVGSGSTVVHVVDAMRRVARENQWTLRCVPTSFQATQLIVDGEADGLRLGSLAQWPVLDVALDGADELDDALHAIKGGGGCHAQERVVAAAARHFVVVVDDSKRVPLGSKFAVPVEVLPLAAEPLRLRLAEMGASSVSLRMAKAKMGPVVSDNGNFILDARFFPIADPLALHQSIKLLPGVVETGLFAHMTSLAVIASKDGSVQLLSNSAK